MELKLGYKLTEVGPIPKEWIVSRVIDLVDGKKELFDDGDWVEAEFLTTNGVRLVQTGNIGLGKFVDKETKKYISAESFAKLRCKDIAVGDVLICRLAEPAGRACALPDIGEDRVITAVDVTILRPPGELVDRSFLVGVFCTPRWFRAVNERCGGSTRTRISRGELGKINVQLPPLTEQRAIAAALSDVDALVDGLDRLIAKKRDLKQAAMQQLLTGRTRLPGFREEWKVTRLGDHVRYLKNGVNSRAELIGAGQVRYLHYGDIHTSTRVVLNPRVAAMPCLSPERANALDRLKDGDIVFVDASEDLDGVGRSVEMAGISGAEVVAGLHTIAARFDRAVLADGFKAYLQFHPAFRAHLTRLAAGTKVYATNRAHISTAEIQLPDVTEQVAIATVLSDMDAELSALDARRDKTRALKQAMMQELLTGRTRLV